MGLASDRLIFITGSIGIIPSGSTTTAATASDSVGQVYVISMSGISATSSLLAPENATGSFFSIKQPDNFILKVFYRNNNNTTVENTGSANFPQSNFKSDSGSVVPVTLYTYSQSANLEVDENDIETLTPATTLFQTGSDILVSTLNALNDNGSLASRFSFSSSLNPDLLFITNLVTGAPPSNDIIIDVSGSSFSNVITTSGSGVPRGTTFEGFASIDSSSFTIDLDPDDSTSAFITGSSDAKLYFSGSGRVGVNTKDPKDDFDIKADSFKIRSRDGKKETEFADGRLLTKKFKGALGAEDTGSQLVLTYTPGTFAAPTTASAGDILGSITWEDLSIGNRDDATALRIQGKVDAVANDGSAIKGSMRFQIGDSTAGQPIREVGNFNLSGLTISGSNTPSFFVSDGYIMMGDSSADRDRIIYFRNDNSSKQFAMGVDENLSRFVIHQGSTITATPDFFITSTGNVSIAGSITAASSNITIINGGTF